MLPASVVDGMFSGPIRLTSGRTFPDCFLKFCGRFLTLPHAWVDVRVGTDLESHAVVASDRPYSASFGTLSA